MVSGFLFFQNSWSLRHRKRSQAVDHLFFREFCNSPFTAANFLFSHGHLCPSLPGSYISEFPLLRFFLCRSWLPKLFFFLVLARLKHRFEMSIGTKVPPPPAHAPSNVSGMIFCLVRVPPAGPASTPPFSPESCYLKRLLFCHV